MPESVKSSLSNIAGGFFGNEYLRDFTHASKTFRTNFYQNAPKLKFLFHVYFDINQSAYNTASLPRQSNFSLLVKNIQLPNFTFDTQTVNQYNRKRIIQTKIKYDPIEITFHDDNNSLITSLWYNYYTYYYKDAKNLENVFSGNRGAGISSPTSDFNRRNIYDSDLTGNMNWGYVGESGTDLYSSSSKVPFFNRITVFGFSNHRFTAYTLINPIITRFGHDNYNYAEGGGTMENKMSIDYETVVYNQGNLDGNKPENIITGFGDPGYYDRKTSPISQPGSNSNILGPTGLLESAGGAITNFQSGSVLSGIRAAGAVYNGFKNVNLKTVNAEINTALQNAMQGTTAGTRDKITDIPEYGATPSSDGTAGTPFGNRVAKDIGNIKTAGTQIINNTVGQLNFKLPKLGG